MESIEIIDITQFMHLDISYWLPEILKIFSFGIISGMSVVILLHLASFAVFGLIEFLDIKDK